MPQIFRLVTEIDPDYYLAQYDSLPAGDDFVIGFSRSKMYFSDYAQSELVYPGSGSSFRIRHAVSGREHTIPAELNESLLAHRALIAKKTSLGDLEAELPSAICTSLRAHCIKDPMFLGVKELLLPYISGECGVPNYLAVLNGKFAGIMVSLDHSSLEQKIIRQEDGSFLYFRTQNLITGSGNFKVIFAVVEQSFVIKTNRSLEHPLTLIRLTKNPILAGIEATKLEAEADARIIAEAPGRVSKSEALHPVSVVGSMSAFVVTSMPDAKSLERDTLKFLAEWERHIYSLGRPALSGEESAFSGARLDELKGEILEAEIRLTSHRRALAGMSQLPAATLPRSWTQWFETNRTRISLRAIAITTIIAALVVGTLASMSIIPALSFLVTTVAAAGLVMSPALLTALLVVLAGLVIASVLLVISTHTGISKHVIGKEESASSSDLLTPRRDAPCPSSEDGSVLSASPSESRRSISQLRIPEVNPAGFGTPTNDGSCMRRRAESEDSVPEVVAPDPADERKATESASVTV